MKREDQSEFEKLCENFKASDVQDTETGLLSLEKYDSRGKGVSDM